MMNKSSLLKKISAAASLCGLALMAGPAQAANPAILNLVATDQQAGTATSGSQSVQFVATTYGFFGDSNITYVSPLTVFTNSVNPYCGGTLQPLWGQLRQGRTDFDADIAYVSCPLPNFTGTRVTVSIQ